jgi:uncharacterized NAD(P)/FAD-binding protein YdhS
LDGDAKRSLGVEALDADDEERRSIAVVGAGPRGLAVLERLCANVGELLPDVRLDVHMIDPHPPGPGRVWRTDQPRDLLMNSFVDEATAFTDESMTGAGPVVPGPTLFEWGTRLAREGRVDGYVPDDRTLGEAKRLGPSSYASRAFQGEYLRWAFTRICSAAAPTIRVVVHQTTAVAIDPGSDDRDVVRLAGEPALTVDTVVLAQGHVDTQLIGQQVDLAAAAPEGSYFGPAHPVDLPLGEIEPGQTVLFRGFGLHFFDCMSQLSGGRGGAFTRDREGILRYRPSGDEPILCPGSRRGVPYEARGDAPPGGRSPAAPPRVFSDLVVGRLQAQRGQADFRRDIWPLLAEEAALAYYEMLAAQHPEQIAVNPHELRRSVEGYVWGTDESAAALAAAVPDRAWRLDFTAWDRPLAGRQFDGGPAFTAWMVAHLHADVAEARQAWQSPKKQAAMRLLSLRDSLRRVLAHGVVTADSYRDDVRGWFTGFSSFIATGPPPARIEELLALAEAGLVQFVGPDMAVDASTDAGFVAWSPAVPDRRLTAPVLIEARLPIPDVRVTKDPLIGQLVATGQARPYRWGAGKEGGGGVETGGMAVSEEDFRLIDDKGQAQRSRFAFGIPTEPPEWLTATGARPGANSKVLLDADAIARAALQSMGSRPTVAPRAESTIGQGVR